MGNVTFWHWISFQYKLNRFELVGDIARPAIASSFVSWWLNSQVGICIGKRRRRTARPATNGKCHFLTRIRLAAAWSSFVASKDLLWYLLSAIWTFEHLDSQVFRLHNLPHCAHLKTGNRFKTFLTFGQDQNFKSHHWVDVFSYNCISMGMISFKFIHGTIW